MKKWVINYPLALLLVMTLILSACTKTNESGSGTGGENNGGSETVQKPKDEVVTVTYWGDSTETYIRKVEQRVKELYPNINLKITPKPSVAGGGDAVINAAAAGTLPDIFDSDLAASQYVDMGIVRPLSAFPDFNSVAENLIAKDAGKMGDGEVYFLSLYGTTANAVYYNTTQWAEAGLTKEDIPKTWEQLIEVAKKLTKDTDGDGRIDQYGIEVATSGRGGYFNFNFGYPLYWSITGKPTEGLISKDGKKVAVDIEAYAKAIELISDLVLKHKVAPPERNSDIMPTGKTVMMMNGPHAAKILDDPDKSKVAGQWDVFPLPTLGLGAATTNYMPVGGRPIMMSKNTKVPDEAWQVIKFMLSEEGQMNIYNGIGQLPALKTVYDKPELKDNKIVQIFNNLENVEPYPRDPFYYVAVNEILSPTLDTVLAGNATPVAAVTEAAETLQKLIDEDLASKAALYKK